MMGIIPMSVKWVGGVLTFNSRTTWGWPAKALHWIGAAIILVLLVLRLLWRWFNPVPEPPAGLKPWERAAARVGHVSLYVLMFIVSLTGWMVATTFRVPITKDLLGLDVPPIVTTVDRSVRQWIEESHMVLAYLLAAVVLIHIIGALRHHILKRNDVLRRMTWGMQV
jgi:cytochrome b561